jgi:ABC-type uncharacterized transport system substrate-binding protein
LILGAVIILGCLRPISVAAHPHVFVDARVEVVFDAEGRLTAITNIWKFDEAFSQLAIEGRDTNGDGNLGEDELHDLAKLNVESLSQYGFFTYLTLADAEAPLLPPVEYRLEFDRRNLTLSYTLPLREPIHVGAKTLLEVFDAEYFVAFTFVEVEPVKLVGAPKSCTATHHAPMEPDAKTMAVLAQIPMDQRTLPPDLAEAAKSLANYITLNCSDSPGATDPAKSSGVAINETIAEVESVSAPTRGFGFYALFLIPLAVAAGGFLVFFVRRPHDRE